MERSTVLARMRATMEFTPAARSWLRRYQDAWFARQGGDLFLSEFGRSWTEALVSVADEEVQRYFRELGVPEDFLPRVEVGDTYRGSWIVELVVQMLQTGGATFAILQGVSSIPQIADGLMDLRNLLDRKANERLRQEVRERLRHLIEDVRREGTEAQTSSPPLPSVPLVDVNFVIDARPLRSLSPAPVVSHKVHLSVAVSRDSVTLENLGDGDMRNVRIGLFKSPTQRKQWSYGEAYIANVPLLSSHQTIMKSLPEFQNDHHMSFDVSDGREVFVDCWVQDEHGIYLFNFMLNDEQ